jgi:sugar O-acyltransferase (sialic acid O-acetyltransferase NeuD family)
VKSNKLAIIGAGGHSREVTQVLRVLGYSLGDVKYYVDTPFLNRVPQKGLFDVSLLSASETGPEVIIAVGDSHLRERFSVQLGRDFSFKSLIHPLATIGDDVFLGLGAQVMQFCAITANVTIGRFPIINIHASIGHDCVVGDFFTASPRSNLTSSNIIGNHVFLGAGSIVLPGVSICDNVILGAGAIVISDITEPGTYVGMPACKIK